MDDRTSARYVYWKVTSETLLVISGSTARWGRQKKALVPNIVSPVVDDQFLLHNWGRVQGPLTPPRLCACKLRNLLLF
jgi:hypothetical protein